MPVADFNVDQVYYNGPLDRVYLGAELLWQGVPPATAPSRPEAPTVVANGQGMLLVSWDPPADGGSPITNYSVRWRPVDGSTSVFDPVVGTTHQLTGLLQGVAYEVEVRASNEIGNSGWGDTTTTFTYIYYSTFDTVQDYAALNAGGWTRRRANGSAGSIAWNASGGNLVRPVGDAYEHLLNNGAGAAPVNYEVEVVITHAMTTQTYMFFILKYSTTTGIRVGWENTTTPRIGTAQDFNTGNVTLVIDAGMTWVGTGDHTVRVRVQGDQVSFYTDGTLAFHGTLNTNQALTGTSFGVGGGNAGVYRSLLARVI